MKLDDAERQLLTLLQADGRMANAKLAEIIGLSESPCFRRVKQLESVGLIKNYVAIVDQRLLGLDITAFVQVSMKDHTSYDEKHFADCVLAEDHIIECHAMSGSYDYLMKVVAKNMDHFSDIAMNKLLKFPGVKTIESSFNLREMKHSHCLPIE
ncbi:Lrp/AsnC family transcriptional regulator [Oceanicoccus sagamiensis]|uniref:AsnC family transcriptional regulator n=1 Tax=Oceanicoccus sagamiensis TaxID=716816 RepID=A0A1X9NB48_9GAMM|nr:Lrp/AsnC family transcriptional regulator [Oceanicoccus sagamiensis]ARN75258.1 AsnC family transcriptional regulator [Oceanicoccus sagamiensis]